MKKYRTLLLSVIVGMLLSSLPAITAAAKWVDTANGKMYTKSGEPGYATGMKTIGDYTYYFDSNGIMMTGLQTIDKKMYYFGADGHLLFGKISAPSGKVYYAEKKGDNAGVLVQNQWVGKYYYQADGTMAVNSWINGKWVGADGRFTGVEANIGWITKGKKTYYYDNAQKMVTGWLNLNGRTYYLNPKNGVLKTGWFSVGELKYYALEDGSVVKSTWVESKYLLSSGAMATGWHELNGKSYFFKTNGVPADGWISYNNAYYYAENGVIQKNAWVDKKTKYVTETGARAAGWLTIKNKTYYFDPETGVKKTGWLTIGTQKYYLSGAGKLCCDRWIKSKSYYMSKDGTVLTGLQKIGDSIYYFDLATGKKIQSKLVTIGTDSYFFQSDGAALTDKWALINSKYYYFQSNGKMAKNTWVGDYYVGLDGARTNAEKKSGWQIIDGVKYYFNGNGKMITEWKTINGAKYYFGTDGKMVTGIQAIDGKKYYFYSTGELAVSVTIAVGAKQYTMNSDGVVTQEESLKIDGDTLGSQIVNFALQYVGNPYVYGGVSLTNGADCSGFVQTVFSNFGIKLLRVADDQMHGPSSSYVDLGYKRAVVVDMASLQAGDLLFYGSGDYASHVAIYMGNGQIVHASNSQPYPAGGIKISNYDYNTPIKAIRYWS